MFPTVVLGNREDILMRTLHQRRHVDLRRTASSVCRMITRL